MECAVDHHEQRGDAIGTREFGDLNHEGMPGLCDPLAAGKNLRHDEFAERHAERSEQDHGRAASAAGAARTAANRIHHAGKEQKNSPTCGAK